MQATFYMLAFLLVAFGQLNAQVNQSFDQSVVDNDAPELPTGPFSMNDAIEVYSTASFIPFPNSVAGKLLSMKMKGRDEKSYQIPFIHTRDEMRYPGMPGLNNFAKSNRDTKLYQLQDYFAVKRKASPTSKFK